MRRRLKKEQEVLGRARRLAALTALLLATAGAGRTPSPQFVHQQWTVEDGLPVNNLTDVVQTSDGWLWIGSFDGLLRFDGARFTRFDTVSTPALRSNRIVRLLAEGDGRGGLWILSEQGHLTQYADGRFNAVTTAGGDAPEGISMSLDANGVLWLAACDGLYRAENGRLATGPEELRGVHVEAVGAGAEGRVWLATGDRRLAVVEGGFVRWAEAGIVAPPQVWFLVEDSDGGAWISTLEHGLFHWRGDGVQEMSASDAVRIVAAGRLVSPSGRREATLRIGGTGSSDYYFIVRQGPRGGVWTSDGHSLNRDGREVLRLAAGAIHAMTFDHEATAWLTTETQGLHALKPARVRTLGQTEGLDLSNVYSLHEDRRGNVWVNGSFAQTFNTGLARFDGEAFVHLDPDHPRPWYAVYDDPGSGRLLVGGLRTLAQEDAGARLVPLADVSPANLEKIYFQAVHRTRDDRLLLGGDGLWTSRRGDPGPDGWRFHQVEGTARWKVRVILEDDRREGIVWLGTNGQGIARVHPDGRLRQVTTAEGLSSDLVRDLYLDADGLLWIATEDRGLNRLDPETMDRPAVGRPAVGRPAVILKRDGLWDDSLHRILEDDAGWLWISTNRGIFRVLRAQLNDFAAGRVPRVDSVAYTEADGMRNREANGGVQGAGIRTRNGELYFPTQAGVAVFDPEMLVRDPPPPQAHVERFWVGEREIPVAGSGGVTLAADERSFRVEYTGLSFRAPERMRFLYRLEGYEDTWQEAGNRRATNYTRVPAGRYTFRVWARSADGVWSRPAACAVVVEPYVHETLAFRAASVLAVVVLGVLALRVRDRRQRRRHRELERLVTERTREVSEQAARLAELDRAKSELYANISHEFRTPLTLTLGPLADLRDGRHGALGPEAVGVVDLARANAARVLNLVNQLLDAARIESGGLHLSAACDDLAAFVRFLAERFVGLAERRQVDFVVTVPDEDVPVYFDGEQLDKVLTNLLANAFKFTPTGGRVELGVVADDDGVAVFVRDDGYGIPSSDLPKIFDRFHQSQGARYRRKGWRMGTGLGLALARDLVELHGGTLEVSSRKGEGSTFTVRLRYGREHLTDEQVVDAPGDFTASATSYGQILAVEAAFAEIGRLPDSEDVAETPVGDPTDDGNAGERLTVLVVDDHPDLRAYVRHQLEDRYRVVEAGDGAAGLVLVRRLVPDVVVSDVMMPLPDSAPDDAPEDGFALCRAIRRDPELEWIPVILLTARADVGGKLEGLDVGADDFLTKPFDARELRARIDNLIAQRHRLRERLRSELAADAPRDAPESPHDVSDHAFLDRLRAAVDARLGDEDLNVDDLASAVGMSRAQLYRRLAGESPATLIMERRLERAAALLAETGDGVSEIAYAVGFKTVSHFCNRFRQSYGVSPTAWRRRVPS